jgi:hypothetical protein
MIEVWRFQVQRAPMCEKGFQIYGGLETKQGVAAMLPVAVQVLPQGSCVMPFLELSQRSAQMLLDELYQAGLRPSREELLVHTATSEHVADLRKIAFKLLDIEGDPL